jgi:tetratricopeptide (TPR) repeat protein
MNASKPYILLLASMAILSGCAAVPRNSSDNLIKGNDLYVKGAMAHQRGDDDQAIAALQAALQENPDLIMARFLLGTIYRDRGEYSAAAVQYKRVVELDPYVASNHYNLGLMYHLLNRLQEAATSYLSALKLNALDVKSNMYLGMVYTALGRADLGLPYVRKAAELDPKNAHAAANLAVVLDTLGDYPAAELSYRRALELDSTRVEVVINLAGCLVSQKRYKEAISLYEQALRLNDSTLLRQRYGNTLVAAGQFDEAIVQFNAALKQNPANYHALNGLGDAYIEQYRKSSMLDETKRAAAVDAWKKSLALNGNQPKISELVKEYSEGLFP